MEPVSGESSCLSSSYSDQITSMTGQLLVETLIQDDVSSTMNNVLATLENQEHTGPTQTVVQPDQRTKSQRRKDRCFEEKQQEQIQALRRKHQNELKKLRQRQTKEQKQRLEQRERYRIERQQAQPERAAQINTTTSTTTTTPRDVNESIGAFKCTSTYPYWVSTTFRNYRKRSIKVITYIFPFNYQQESSYSDEEEGYEEELNWWQEEEIPEATDSKTTPPKKKREENELRELQSEDEAVADNNNSEEKEQLHRNQWAETIVEQENA